MIKNMIDGEKDAVLKVADLMLAAAKTAPKGSGKNTVRGFVITGTEKDKLAEKMRELSTSYDIPIFNRDANNVDQSLAVVVLGSIQKPFGLKACGMCGFPTCTDMKKGHGRCVFNVTDLGIALGSAVEIAAKNHIDNRIMYTVGRAAVKLDYFVAAGEENGEEIEIAFGIPLYTGSKSIFFDRNPGAVLI